MYENLDNTAPLVLGDAEGIELVASRFSDVSQNIVHHNGVVGIQLRDGSTQNTVRGNQVRANGAQAPGLDGRGIGSRGAGTHDNRILQNEVLDNYGRGIVIRRPAGTAPITCTLVAQNRVHGNQRSGIAIMFAAAGNVVLQNDAVEQSLWTAAVLRLQSGGAIHAHAIEQRVGEEPGHNLTDPCMPVMELYFHVLSFPRMAPLDGQASSRADPQGNQWLRATLVECARGAVGKRNCYLAAQYRRLAKPVATRPPSSPSRIQSWSPRAGRSDPE